MMNLEDLGQKWGIGHKVCFSFSQVCLDFLGNQTDLKYENTKKSLPRLFRNQQNCYAFISISQIATSFTPTFLATKQRANMSEHKHIQSPQNSYISLSIFQIRIPASRKISEKFLHHSATKQTKISQKLQL